jgi:uncharacterized protein with HEPN domain
MRNDEAVLLDIDMAARRITGFVQGLTFEQFFADERTWSAVLYQVSVIGEAVKRLSDTYRAQHPSIPWTQMAGMRNKVIHGYDTVDFERVWETATVSVPELRAALSPLIASDTPS